MSHPEDTLTYARPAAAWLEALPLGNGRLAAMVFGGVTAQRIQVNDASAWSGSPRTEGLEPVDAERFARTLARVRSLLAAGELVEADRLARGLQHRHSQAYLPFGDLDVVVAPHGEAGDYRRDLDLSTGVHTERYTVGGATVSWTTFVDRESSVLVVRMRTDVEAGLDVSFGLTSPLCVLDTSATQNGLEVTVRMPSDVYPAHEGIGGVSYSDDPTLALQGALALTVRSDGVASSSGGRVAVTGAHDLVLLLATGTTAGAVGQAPSGDAESVLAAVRERLALAERSAPSTQLARHQAAHAALYDRVALRIGTSENGAAPVDRATDARLLAANAHPGGALAVDPGLAELLFNYGRYLLLSSSTPGGVPATLQGLWNEELPAPWSSNYTVNINLQMNYWAAEAVGLVEALEPLFDLVDLLRVTGGATARELYDARGWAAHHNADVWGYSHPVGHGNALPRWSLWPMAGFWLVQHLWDHLQFAAPGDPDAGVFLRERLWPALRSAAEFGLDWMVEMPDQTLGTSPSTSPENGFLVGDAVVDVGVSSTMDLTLLRETFAHLATLADRLGLTDDPVVLACAAALPRLPRPSAGRDGQVREWLADDPQAEPEHRHVSHLWFLYPGDTQSTTELEVAASASLDARGDESTGWSLAWKLALRARLGQADKVSDLLRLVFRDMTTDRGGQSGGLYANLFAAHPPYQIDGNFGYVAGLVEALLQSHAGVIHLLPALPVELPDGRVRGLRARGGVTVDLEWADGRLVHAELASPVAQPVRVRVEDAVVDVALAAGIPHVVGRRTS